MVTRPTHRWTPTRMAALEEAVSRHRRVALTRRGTEYVVIARELQTRGRTETLVGHLPMTGENLEFALHEIEAFDVLAT